jgi:Xaa-Pro aminopeptidase
MLDIETLEEHKRVQRLAYDCVEAIARTLKPGVTEKDAARAMRKWAEARGVDDWFHLPFAWFGDRTAFVGFRHPLQFFPTNRALEPGMPFILDVAPVVRGVSADVGYSGALGRHSVVEGMLDDLAAHRALILRLVNEGRTFANVYAEVDRLMARQGYENRHRKYPFGVIAHRIERMSPTRGRGTFAGFGLKTLRTLGESVAIGLRRGDFPLWSAWRLSDHAPSPGLWAVEPHLGRGGVGAKFEELLVVPESGKAYWLDDDLPHVRRIHRSTSAEAAS